MWMMLSKLCPSRSVCSELMQINCRQLAPAQPYCAVGGSRHRRGDSPASIPCRSNGECAAEQRSGGGSPCTSGFHRCDDAITMQSCLRELMQIVCEQLAPGRCFLPDTRHRYPGRRFQIRLFGGMSNDGGDPGGEQVVEVPIILRRQAAGQNAPSSRHGARHRLYVQRSGPSTRQASGLGPEYRQSLL